MFLTWKGITRSTVTPAFSIHTEGKTDGAKMTQTPEAEKEKSAEQVADFKKLKSKLYVEIEIWTIQAMILF